jgi:thiol-disulfide isomerase/thioredoxin
MTLTGRLSALLLGAVLLLAACSHGPQAVPRQPLLPAFELESLDGTHFSSKALAGKVVLVDFWATWCRPCLEEIPFWNQLQKRYAERGFTMLGITVQSGWASDIKSDIEKSKLEISYPVVVGDEKIAQEFGGVLGFPTTFLITRGGRIYKKYTGQYPAKESQIEGDIQTLLSHKR